MNTRQICVGLMFLILTAFPFPASVGSPASDREEHKTSSKEVDNKLDRLLKLHNKHREEAGVKPLKLNEKLTKAAHKYAQFLAKNDKFSHEAEGTPSSRVKEEGYHWQAVGENIAKGQDSPAEVVNSWMKSPGHKKNILDPRFKEVGFGHCESIWVTIFGSPR